ncbi:MAG TPA: hypothetical protein VHT71_02525 [Methylomirabilota bacterium]|nr:hypothetical protein [Methylomirabilota bacterium]
MAQRSVCAFFAGAVLLGVVSVAGAQSVETGTIVRIDPQSRVVLMDDGRMYRVTQNTMLVVDNRPTAFTALAPGQRLTIQSGEIVALQGGQYVAVSAAPQPTVVTPAPAPTVVAQAPAPASAVPVGVRQTVFGTISEVDSNGEVKIKTQRDSFEIRVSPDVARQIKKGDNVTLDVMITPPGAPSASPR